MATSSTDCLSQTALQPNSTVLAGIEACQTAANMPYCYPPNGTRICIPSKDIPFYWPSSYFSPDSKIAIEYETKLDKAQNNSGYGTYDFSESIYAQAVLVQSSLFPGDQGEVAMKMYFIEQRNNDDISTRDPIVHDGPTLILVDTVSAAPTIVVMTPTTTARNMHGSEEDSDDEDDDDAGGPKLHPGAIAGAVIGSIIAAVVLFLFCCRGCCYGAKRRGNPDEEKEHPHTIEQGTELAQQKSVPNSNGAKKLVSTRFGGLDPAPGSHEIERMDAARIAQHRGEVDSAYMEAPPPRYTP
ncbi:hypothetical protein BKA66DRAFT_570639 [Pyrenochaeta sp. MPI-SDFR-AT-0127]|nr:hypothetical protein BKA66DRAFT_570639 [Pyrenochaeta sp. MPI-SDFR-AT-0127]